MEIIEITKDNFESEVLRSEKPVIVDFFAVWCSPCKALSKVIDEIANERDDIKVCKINVDNERELAMKHQVMSIPTVIAFKNGEIVNKTIGLVTKEDILALV